MPGDHPTRSNIQIKAYCVKVSHYWHLSPLLIQFSDGTRCLVARRFGLSSVSNHLS